LARDLFSLGHPGMLLAALASLLGGMLFIVALFFYFKALFCRNDVSAVQLLWNLTIVAVPLFSFVLLGEWLGLREYAGMAVVLAGASVISLGPGLKKSITPGFLRIMAVAIAMLSLSMIAQEHSYDTFEAARGGGGFWIGFLFFSLGSFLCGLAFSFFSRRSVWELIGKYCRVLIVCEGVNFLGNLASQRALDVAPSASFVAAVETFVPVFVIIYSSIIIFFASRLSQTPKLNNIKAIYRQQTFGAPAKAVAAAIMAVGVWIMS
jgi:uncharacterized membrane protein